MEFKVGDRVRVNRPCNGTVDDRMIGKVGTVIDIDMALLYPIYVKLDDPVEITHEWEDGSRETYTVHRESFREDELDLLDEVAK